MTKRDKYHAGASLISSPPDAPVRLFHALCRPNTENAYVIADEDPDVIRDEDGNPSRTNVPSAGGGYWPSTRPRHAEGNPVS